MQPPGRREASGAGGGGFGSPLERPPQKVAHDVRQGYVSRQSAREDYGVVLDAEGGVDERGTLGLRTSRS